jgi:uncharacterized oligopeptide transporter (OPT) family protein
MSDERAAGEPELTARAVAIGLFYGALLAAGNVYSGIKIGYLDAGLSVIVLLSFATFAAGRRPLSRLETSIAMAAGCSAATMALTTGLVGPVPALALGGHSPPMVWVAIWGAALGVFGTLLAVPFRRQMIVEDALPFPSGQASGELIKTLAAEPGSSGGRVLALLAAATAAVLIVLLRDVWAIIPAAIVLPIAIGGLPSAALGVGLGISPLMVGVGLLVGPRIAISMLGGGLLAWCFLAPALHGHAGLDATSYGSVITWLVWPGASLMVAGSLATLAFDARKLWRAWTQRRTSRDGAEWRWVRAGTALCALATVVVGWIGFGVSPIISLFSLIIGVVFSIVAMRATGETDQTPGGPLGALAQGLVGLSAPGSTVPTLFAGGVTNGAAAHSATMMQVWKTGEVLSGSPGKLLAVQLAGVAVGAVTSVLGYVLIDQAYGIGSPALPSPPAQSWKATADVVQGGFDMMPAGAPLASLIAATAALLLTWLERSRAARFVPSPIAVGIGFILPVFSSAGIALGALLFAISRRVNPTLSERQAPALAAGLITGEALIALILAALVVTGLL